MIEHTLIVTQTREIHVFKTQFEESVQKKEVVSQTSNYSKEYRNETETPGRLGSRGCSGPCGLQRQSRVVDGGGGGGSMGQPQQQQQQNEDKNQHNQHTQQQPSKNKVTWCFTPTQPVRGTNKQNTDKNQHN